MLMKHMCKVVTKSEFRSIWSENERTNIVRATYVSKHKYVNTNTLYSYVQWRQQQPVCYSTNSREATKPPAE